MERSFSSRQSQEPNYFEVNSSSYYYEHQILKVWDIYVKKKQLCYWVSPNKDICKSLFSTKNTMSLAKQSGLLITPKRNSLYITIRAYSLSICGPVAHHYKQEPMIKDFVKGIKQIFKWNKTQQEQIQRHIMIFPYNIDGVHWCLGLVKLLISHKQIGGQVQIFNPLPSLGGTKIDEEVFEAILENFKKVFIGFKIDIVSAYEKNYEKQQNDFSSCGVISAENGKDFIDGVTQRLNLVYQSGAFDLRAKHLQEVNDQRFAQIQYSDEIVELQEFEVDSLKKNVIEKLFQAFTSSRTHYNMLVQKFRTITPGTPPQNPRRSAQLIRDIFQSNRRYFSGIFSKWQIMIKNQKLEREISLYDILFKENKEDLEFQDETINILQIFTEKVYNFMTDRRDL